MLSSAGANNKTISCSPSKSSSSTCSSLSPIPRKSMEEVWKDINLSSLNDHTTTTTNSAASTSSAGVSFRGMVFQDFLATPHHKDPPTRGGGSSNRPIQPLPPPPCACAESTIFPSPATVLSLNSGPDFQYLESSDIISRQNPPLTPSFFSSLSSPFDSSMAVFPDFPKKRASENNDEHNSGDPRYKRMMKNRESAARSRARRQAYTNELELEVAHLMEENKQLKKQQQKLLLAVPPVQVPKLARTLTAPF